MIRIRKWFIREGGVSEAATAIFVLPLIAALVFLIVETGFNIRTRTMIDSIIQDTTRSVALEGGWNNARATSLPTGKTWISVGTSRLQSACASGVIRTDQACNTLTVVCNPQVASFAGDIVTCALGTAITYKTVSPLSTNPLFSYGMQGVFTTPITSSVSSVAAVGTNS